MALTHRVEVSERVQGRSDGAVEEGALCNARLKELSQPSLMKRRLRGGFIIGCKTCEWKGNLLREDSVSSRQMLGSTQVEGWG